MYPICLLIFTAVPGFLLTPYISSGVPLSAGLVRGVTQAGQHL